MSITKEQVLSAYDEYRFGRKTIVAMAGEMNMTPSALRYYFRRYGLRPIRSRSGNAKQAVRETVVGHSGGPSVIERIRLLADKIEKNGGTIKSIRTKITVEV